MENRVSSGFSGSRVREVLGYGSSPEITPKIDLEIGSHRSDYGLHQVLFSESHGWAVASGLWVAGSPKIGPPCFTGVIHQRIELRSLSLTRSLSHSQSLCSLGLISLLSTLSQISLSISRSHSLVSLSLCSGG
jgi:hypothetical protein